MLLGESKTSGEKNPLAFRLGFYTENSIGVMLRVANKALGYNNYIT